MGCIIQHVRADFGAVLHAPVDDWNLMNWRATIEGPPGKPYEGGKIQFSLFLPFDYPESPPRVTVETQLYHPTLPALMGVSLPILNFKWAS